MVYRACHEFNDLTDLSLISVPFPNRRVLMYYTQSRALPITAEIW